MSNRNSLITSIEALTPPDDKPLPLLKSKSSMTPSKHKTSLNDFDIQSELGKGSFGKVYLAKDKHTKRLCAIKALDKHHMDRLNKAHEALAEREVLRQMDHPNVIKLYSTFQSSAKLFYVLEYCNNGNLKEFLETNGQLPLKLAQFYAAEIVHVLGYFEEKGIAHRDIKPGNIMLDESHHLKFIDFGTATMIGCRYDMKQRQFLKAERSMKDKELVGTAEYAAPEMLNHCVKNERSCDLWALGCILYQFFHGETPFKGFNEKETIENAKRGEFTLREDIDPFALDLIRKLLSTEAGHRIGMTNIKDLMNHPFFNGIDFNGLCKALVPKMLKSKSVFCLNKGSVEQDIESVEDEDHECLYREDTSSYLVNTSYCNCNERISENTLTSLSTVISSPLNTHFDEEGSYTPTKAEHIKNELIPFKQLFS